MFIAGLVLFSAASLAGGFATSEAWLLGARAVQGVGGALIAPTALALITTTFAEGRARNRAMGVYAAMSGGGAAVGLVAGGLLTTYLSWRWVFFVNVPIGIAVAVAAPLVLAESARRRGRFDLPGAITGTGAVALLVYGLSNAGTDQTGVSHWTEPKVLVSLIAAAVLLISFVAIESRSRHALMPLRILANRSRSGAYLIMLLLATAMFGIFFFLTIFVQTVLGYSALKSGVAFLPFAGTLVLVSGIVSQLISRTGARPLMLAGSAATAGGMYWFSHISVHTTYLAGLLGPSLVTGAGLGMLFVPLSLVVLTRVRDQDSGLASSLLNTAQQVGGAIGLAALGTVAWTTVANSARSQVAMVAAAADRSGHPPQAKPRLPAARIDLPQRPRSGDLPRFAGRLRDSAGRADHRRGDHPRPSRGPHRRRHRDRPGAAGQRCAGNGADQFLAAAHPGMCIWRGGGEQHVSPAGQHALAAAPAPSAHPTAVRTVR